MMGAVSKEAPSIWTTQRPFAVDSFTFMINTEDANGDVTVTFTPLWGVAVDPDIAPDATCGYSGDEWIVSPPAPTN